MSRSASSIGLVASARSSSASVTPDMRRAVSAQARMPSAVRSLVYANPSRCSSRARIPTPRSQRATTLSITPSLVSTEPDCASRMNTSPWARPSARSASRAFSTATSFVTRSLIRALPASGWRVLSRVRGRARAYRSAPHHFHPARSDAAGMTARTRPAHPCHPPAGLGCRSLELPAHNDRGDADRRLRISDRRALAVLATGPRGIAKVISDHVYFAHQLWPLTYERRAAERLGELAVADPVALRDLEGEVARD